jgi:polygalacturonase
VTAFLTCPLHATGAPAARTLLDRVHDIFKVKDFDAKGDGTSEDTSAIAASVAAGSTFRTLRLKDAAG